MAVSTCIKCDGHSFELALFTPLGEDQKLAMVQCANCGTPVGVVDQRHALRSRRCKARSRPSMTG